MESKWSRVEQYLSDKTKEALDQKAYDKEKGRGYQIRYYAMACRRPFASEKDYRAFAEELNNIVKDYTIKGHRLGAKVIGLRSNGVYVLATYLAMSTQSAKKFDEQRTNV